MAICNYCQNSFIPRPQVKRPKACKASECQRKRQRDNERSWHKIHKDQFNKKYHNQQKKKRFVKIVNYASLLLGCFKIGAKFSDMNINMEIL